MLHVYLISIGAFRPCFSTFLAIFIKNIYTILITQYFFIKIQQQEEEHLENVPVITRLHINLRSRPCIKRPAV